MFDENKFRGSYKDAYNKLSANEDVVKQLKEYSVEKKRFNVWHSFKPMVAALGILCLVTVISKPALAGVGNFAYEKIAEIAPGLADYILPVKMADTQKGITMQVEAMQVEGNSGKILVSFADEEGSDKDYISGKVDMYDSYNLKSYGSDSNIGGCSFVEYDEEIGKAYFMVGVSSENAFDKTKLKFSVRQLLVENREYEMQLDTDMLVVNPPLKETTINGKSGNDFAELFYKTEESFPLFATKVMDLVEPDETMKDTIQVTGIGYSDGILRVQICRGTLSDADRHANIYLVDESGERKSWDGSAGWIEEFKGEKLSYDEQWFIVSEEDLNDLKLYGEFFESDGSVDGNWIVTVGLENGN